MGRNETSVCWCASPAEKIRDPLHQFVQSFPGKLMFPHTQHPPALCPQRPCHNSVTSLILCEFVPPVCAALHGVARMSWATMPKTAIHKHRNACLSKNEIWLADQPLVTPPTNNMKPSEDFY